MSKSKSVFLIMFLGYVTVALLNVFNVTSVGDQVLLGLSLCAMTMSISDCISIAKVILLKTHHLKYMAKVTTKFIDTKLKQSIQIHNTIVNIRNVKKNIEMTNNGYEKSKHPSLYEKKITIKIISAMENLLFTIAIFIFVMTPFTCINIGISSKVTVLITLLAFGFMCLNVFLSEIDARKTEKINSFFNNTQVIINTVFSDFSYFLSSQLYYREDLVAAKEAHEAKLNDCAIEDIINNSEMQTYDK